MPRSSLWWLLLVAVLAAACSGGGGGGTPETATLHIIDGMVEVSEGGGDFTPGREAQVLAAGDVVRTGTDGRAAIDWFDGSVTRLEAGTTFDIAVLESLEGSPVVEGRQGSGASYHRVVALTGSQGRFDTVTPVAVASVQGTVYAVVRNADGSFTFFVFEGSISVAGDGVKVVLHAGQMVTVGADGTIGEPEPIPDDLLDDDWIRFNRCDLDQEEDCRAPFDHIVLTPDEATIPAGDVQAYVVEAFDAEGESMGDVTSEAVLTGEGCEDDACGPTEAGDYEIAAEYMGAVATAQLVVTPGPAASIEVTPSEATVRAGEEQRYRAEGFDEFGNPLGRVDAEFEIVGGTCSGRRCSSTQPGEHRVRATFDGVRGRATLTVTPGALASIVLSPEAATVDTGEPQAYTAQGYDAYGNALGTVPASLSIAGGFCEEGTCTSTSPGNRTVTASYQGFEDTAVLTVVTGPPHHLALYPSIGSLGVACVQQFTAAVVDQFGNLVDDDSSTITFSDIDGGVGSQVTFSPSATVGASNGVASVSATATSLGWVSLRASSGSLTSNTITFEVTWANNCIVVFSVVPTGARGAPDITLMLVALLAVVMGSRASSRRADGPRDAGFGRSALGD